MNEAAFGELAFFDLLPFDFVLGGVQGVGAKATIAREIHNRPVHEE
jgi:hypothetical protein